MKKAILFSRISKYVVLISITVLAAAVTEAVSKVQFNEAPVSAVIDDKARGSLQIGDRQVAITFAAGALSRSFGKTRALIYLANESIDPFGEELQGQVENGVRHYVEIIVDEEGSVIGFNICTNLLHDSRLVALNAAPVNLGAKQIGGERITGRVFNEEPVLTTYAGKTHEIRIAAEFSAALVNTGAKRKGQDESKTFKPVPSESRQQEQKPFQPSAEAGKAGPKIVWDNAGAVINEIMKTTGTRVQPIYIRFGIAGRDFIQFHYSTGDKDDGIKTVIWENGQLSEPRASDLARPCQPIPLEEINFDLVPKIFADVSKKVERGYDINVTLGRRFTDDCSDPEWQGIAQYLSKMLIIRYSLDGQQKDIEKYSY